MNPLRTPLVLLGLLLVLGGVAYWDDWKTQKEEGAKKTENKLFSFEDKDVTAIDFFHKGDQDGDVVVRLEKKDDQWRVTQPVAAPAAPEEVANLLKNVREYQYERVAAETKDRWKDFGLEAPTAKITVHLPTGEQTLFLGIKAPVGYSMYAATGQSDKAYLGSQYIDLATNKKLFDFRDKALASIKTDDLAKLSLKNPGAAPVVMARLGEKWTFTAPQSMEADFNEIVAFVNSLNAERVEAFFDKPSDQLRKTFAGKTKDAKVVAELNWETTDGTKRQLTFTKNGAELLASENPETLIVRIPEAAANKLAKTANDFRFRKVFAFDPLKAKAMTVDGVAYEKKEDKWKRKDQNEPADHIGALLFDLGEAKTDRFEDLAGKQAQSMGSPTHTFILELEDPSLSKVEVSLWADKKAAGKFFLKHTAGAYLYRVDGSVLQNINPQSRSQAPDLGEMPDGHDHG